MARGRKKKEQVQKTIRLKPSELKQAITDASRHKAEKAFETANRKVAKPDALSDLAGDAAPVH